LQIRNRPEGTVSAVASAEAEGTRYKVQGTRKAQATRDKARPTEHSCRKFDEQRSFGRAQEILNIQYSMLNAQRD
jgi:hypothetical protein